MTEGERASRGRRTELNRRWRHLGLGRRHDNRSRYRARRYGVPVEPVDYRRVYLRSLGCCSLCGEPIPFGAWSWDHRVPLSRGGAHETANLDLVHQRCNRRKHVKTVDQLDWFRPPGFEEDGGLIA